MQAADYVKLKVKINDIPDGAECSPRLEIGISGFRMRDMGALAGHVFSQHGGYLGMDASGTAPRPTAWFRWGGAWSWWMNAPGG